MSSWFSLASPCAIHGLATSTSPEFSENLTDREFHEYHFYHLKKCPKTVKQRFCLNDAPTFIEMTLKTIQDTG